MPLQVMRKLHKCNQHKGSFQKVPPPTTVASLMRTGRYGAITFSSSKLSLARPIQLLQGLGRACASALFSPRTWPATSDSLCSVLCGPAARGRT